VLYLHGRTGMYLEPAPGESGINNIVKMARDGLRRDLTTALHKTVRAKEAHSAKGLRVKTNGHYTLVNLSVCPVVQGPVAALESPLYLVMLEQAAPLISAPLGSAAPADAKPKPEAHDSSDAHAQIAELKEELQAKEEYLHAANEELETANDELKSSNEEMQSVNEELQSSNEELETSKEELQSINEELSTVNAELQTTT
jgi:two-component system CheB/CheR fusion protein